MGPSQPARRFRYGVAMSLDGHIVGSLVTDLKTKPGKISGCSEVASCSGACSRREAESISAGAVDNGRRLRARSG
jgi:hypothetical protein